MRSLALFAAFAVMHATHALPRRDLTARPGENDLNNDPHIFHHLDRNQRTANRDHEYTHGDGTKEPGLYVVKRLPDRPQQAGAMTRVKERAVDKRFIQEPDYSQEDSGSGSDSAGPASNTVPTQPRWKNQARQTAAMGDPEA